MALDTRHLAQAVSYLPPRNTLTAAEARSRWCPMARQADTENHTYNRLDNGEAPLGSRCLAAECAVWRWVEVQSPDPEKHLGRCGLTDGAIR